MNLHHRLYSALILALLTFVISSQASLAKVIYVKTDGLDTNDGLSWSTAKKTIQSAVNAANPDGEVRVAAGSYTESLSLSNTNIHLLGGYAGVGETRDIATHVTTIDGGGVGAVARVSSSSLPNSPVIEGFTIRNAGPSGAAIYCTAANATISNNRITENDLTIGLSVILCTGAAPTITGNYIVGNYAGGIECRSSTPTIANNVIKDSGGIRLQQNASGPSVVANNIIIGSGIGVQYVSHTGSIINNTIVSCFRGIEWGTGSSGTVANNVIAYNICGIWGSVTPVFRHNCVYGNGLGSSPSPMTTDNGNIVQDPRFASVAFGNLHLQTGSPCIDAGDNSLVGDNWRDMDGQDRLMPIGGVVDIGADESAGTVWSEGPGMVIRVSPNGNDACDGLSWEQPKRSVQAAVDAAARYGGEVWVKAGTYFGCITLPTCVHLYGGFDGTETSRDDRNSRANVTVLDGQQSGSVVSAPWSYANATIDGFTICNGRSENGAGINAMSPVITNNIITGNTATMYGGGIRAASGALVTRNTISRNRAGHGGGFQTNESYSAGASSRPVLDGNTIVDNAADYYGGGVHGSAVLKNNLIRNNSSRDGAAIYCYDGHLAIGNTIVFNSAQTGVVMGHWNWTFVNNIVAFNSSGILAGSDWNWTLSNNCVYGNRVYDYSGVAPGATDLRTDPRFADANRGDFHIRLDSPCRDVGTSAPVQPDWLDMDGQPRILPVGGTVDIGADESDGTTHTPQPLPIIRVKPDGNDANDGSSWLLAKQTIQSAIDAASEGGGEVWVKAGAYAPITLKAYAHVYGGFAGTETSRSQRNWRLNLTTISGGGAGSAVAMNGGWMPSTLDGFSITNGSAPSGGGIYLNLAAPTIANCIISGCSADLGGGIYCGSSGATITACDILGNTASTDGGGICDVNSTCTLTNNILRNNSAQRGGGLFVYSNSSVLNNTISDNQSSVHGGGIFCNNSKATVRNNIIAFNQRGLHVYVAAGGGLTPTVSNNCIYGNTGYDYYGISRPSTDIPMNPAFVNKAGGDFHLSSTSFCIDKGSATGAPSVDKDGNLRPQDGNTDGRAYHDIGAYEYPFNLTKAKRQLADNQLFAMIGSPVTAVFDGRVYLEMPDRTSGIRVDTSESLSVGQVVNLSGKIYTDSLTGERYVLANAGYPQQMGSELTLQPFGFSNSVLGGGSLGLQCAVWSKQWVKDENDQWQRMWAEAMGLNNIGLLVTTFGNITCAGDGFFYLDDGSALDDGSGHTGVKVQAAGLTFPSEGFVKATGIISCEKNTEGKIIRLLKVRKQEDIQQ